MSCSSNQSRPRGAPRHRPHLYDRAPCARPAGRLAAHHVSLARGQADDRRNLLAARAALWPTLVPPGSPVDRRAWRTQRNEMENRGLTLADHLAKLSELKRGPGRLARRPYARRGCAQKRGRSGPWGFAARQSFPMPRSSASFGTRCSVEVTRPSARRYARCCEAYERGRHLRSSRRRLRARFD